MLSVAKLGSQFLTAISFIPSSLMTIFHPIISHLSSLASVLQENAENLPLYGRADHLGVAALPPLPFESVIMAFRAIYLIAAFLPFLLFGPLLLLLSGLILRIDRTFSRRPTVTVVSAVPASAALAPALPAARGRVANLVAGAETPYTFETRSNRSATRFRRRRRRDRQRAVGEDEGIGERRAWSSVEEMMEKAPESLGMSGTPS